MSANDYEVVIGLEVHVHLATKSKIFSASSAAFGAAPNASTDPVSLGLPGTLPVLNRAVVEAALRLGLAAECKLRSPCRFARKHYFYPDMPKNFQISQYEEPLWDGGSIAGVKLTRIHLEEDAGKLVHGAAGKSFVDYNRAGVGLCEIVSEPDIRSSEAAADYVRAVRGLVRDLGISDGNMEEGSLRCDANVSLRRPGAAAYGTKVEIKNLNSFKNLRDAIEHEVKRQAQALDGGQRVVQETRLWDPDRGVTQAMRSKEQAHDYRYFPEPDLPPLVVDEAWLSALRATLPKRAEERAAQYREMGLSPETTAILIERPDIASYFDSAVAIAIEGLPEPPPKRIGNLLVNEVLGLFDDPPSQLPARELKTVTAYVESGKISSKQSKEILARLAAQGGTVVDIVKAEGLAQVSDSGALEEACRSVVGAHPAEAERLRGGEAKLIGFFVGAVMKETGGKANPKAVNEILRRLLGGG